MPKPNAAPTFDSIIQADRQRKKNEDLAKEIFGKSRPSDPSRRKDTKTKASTPSLASRIGISKRSSSTSGAGSPRNPPSRPSSATAQHARNNRLATEIHNNQTANVITTKSAEQNLSIKGSAAPFVVEASNFAPGTSEADIASAIAVSCVNASGINALLSCKIIATKPSVIAELVFNERSIANDVIAKYDMKNADGYLLKLKLVRSGPGSMSKHHRAAPRAQSATAATTTATTTKPAAEDVDEMEEDVDMNAQDVVDDSYNRERQAAERGRRDRDSHKDRDSRYRTDDDRRNDRRDTEDDRDRDRRRGTDSERNDRGERSSYQREETSNGSRGSHYGNGIGGAGRSQYGGSYAGGRGSYPGFGGFASRGGYRGSYRGYR